jgi:hypothetical protein
MDPDAALNRFRVAVRLWQEAMVACAANDEHAALVDAAEAARDLDRWLSNGGFPPASWWTPSPNGSQIRSLRSRHGR